MKRLSLTLFAILLLIVGAMSCGDPGEEGTGDDLDGADADIAADADSAADDGAAPTLNLPIDAADAVGDVEPAEDFPVESMAYFEIPAVMMDASERLEIGAATAPPGCSTVLLSQLPVASPLASASQDFEASLDSYDCFGADDFTVPAGQSWRISSIYVYGVSFVTNGVQNAHDLSCYIFTNNSGVPNGIPAGYGGGGVNDTWTPADANIAFYNGGQEFHAFPHGTLTLPAGDYWVSCYPRMDFTGLGQWYWSESAANNGSEAKWINPGNGFGWGSSWQSITVTGTSDDNLAIEICGTSSTTTTTTTTTTTSTTTTTTTTPTTTTTTTTAPTTTTTSPTTTSTTTTTGGGDDDTADDDTTDDDTTDDDTSDDDTTDDDTTDDDTTDDDADDDTDDDTDDDSDDDAWHDDDADDDDSGLDDDDDVGLGGGSGDDDDDSGCCGC